MIYLKRIIVLLLSALFLLSGCSYISEDRESETFAETDKYEDCINLRIPMYVYTNYPTDLPLVTDEINKITSEKIGVTVEIVAIEYSTKGNAIELLESEGKTLDLTYGGFNFIPITELAEKYAKETLDLFSEDEKARFMRNGEIYSIPSKIDRATCACIMMRKDLLDKYDIDIDTIKTIDDFDRIAAIIAKNEPNMSIIAPNETEQSFFNKASQWHSLAASTFVLMDGGQSDKVEILYRTELYRKYVSLFYKWNQAGYFPDEMKMDTLRSSRLVSDGSLFAYFYSYKPGVEVEESINCHREMVCLRLNEPFVTSASYGNFSWGVTEDCSAPEAAVKLLNLMFTDPDIMNLLSYGIEGIHYVVNSDGMIDFPEGVTSETCGYCPNIAWEYPNQFITYVREGNSPTLWEDMVEFNDSAVRSKAIGFSFDRTPVNEEYSAVRDVVSKYSGALARGQVNPEEIFPIMDKELDEAGADTVLAEVQRQLDMFLSEQNSN